MRSRPVSKFKSYTHRALADLAQGIHDAISAHGTYTPSITLANQQTAIDDLNAAILAWGPPGNHGSKLNHSQLIDARNAEEEILRNLFGWADCLAAGSVTIIESLGMVAN